MLTPESLSAILTFRSIAMFVYKMLNVKTTASQWAIFSRETYWMFIFNVIQNSGVYYVKDVHISIRVFELNGKFVAVFFPFGCSEMSYVNSQLIPKWRGTKIINFIMAIDMVMIEDLIKINTKVNICVCISKCLWIII